MIAIRKERPPDTAAREVLLDEAFGKRRWRKSSQLLRNGRAPAEGLAFVATKGNRGDCPALDHFMWCRQAGAAVGAGGGRGR